MTRSTPSILSPVPTHRRSWVEVTFNRPVEIDAFHALVAQANMKVERYELRGFEADGRTVTIGGGPLDGVLVPENKLREFAARAAQRGQPYELAGVYLVVGEINKAGYEVLSAADEVFLIDVTKLLAQEEIARETNRTLPADEINVVSPFIVLEHLGEASSGEEALRLIEELCPDVLVLDVVMPEMNGMEATRLLRESHPDLRILALSAYDENECVFGILKAVASGYVLKEEALDTIVEAIRAASRGETWLSKRVQEKVVRKAVDEEEEVALTERKLEVLRLMAKGWSNRRIAKHLFISEGTVKKHVTNIYAKLGVHSRAMEVTCQRFNEANLRWRDGRLLRIHVARGP